MSITAVDRKRFVDVLDHDIIEEMHDNDPKKVHEVLNGMIDYAWDHFKVEEAQMLKFKCPEYKQHKDVHLDFVLKTLSYFKRVADGDCQILDEIREYLKQWLANHIQGIDRKYIYE